MSRIGRKPVPIPSGVEVVLNDAGLTIRGPKGALTRRLPPGVRAELRDGAVHFSVEEPSDRARAFCGLARSLAAGMVAGVTAGFSRELELQGVGFRAAVQGSKLSLSLGFASPVQYEAPAGISLQLREGVIVVSGADKQLVGDVAARIRSFYPPEPYKGKGVRYKGEHVRRKAGKTVA